MNPAVGDRMRRKNGVIGTVVKVFHAHERWEHPTDHCDLAWSDGTEGVMTMMGLRRLERV